MERRDTQQALSALSVLVLALAISAPAQYGGGTGEPNDPYLIYTPEQMNAIGVHGPMGGHFRLMADIDLGEYKGAEFNIIGRSKWPFRGTFDGNGHAMSNFTWDRSEVYVGLFGYIDGPNAEVRNLRLIEPDLCMKVGYIIGALGGHFAGGVIRNCRVEGGRVVTGLTNGGEVGGLVGINGGTIVNCHTSCSVSGPSSIGGLVGRSNGTIIDCSTTGDIRAHGPVGGLVGNSELGTLSNCYAMGAVSGENSVGGLVGSVYPYGGDDEDVLILTNCYAMGTVDGNDCVGGLVGSSYLPGWNDEEGVIFVNCYATGTVDGNEWIGGLVGGSTRSAFEDCHATGSIDGSNRVGGLIGNNDNGTLGNCYATGHVKGRDYVGGLVGRDYDAVFRACRAIGRVDGNDSVGGLLGDSRSVTIAACHATGNVVGNDYAGGLIGRKMSRPQGKVSNCYATGSVSGNNYVAGLLGYSDAAVTNCYATGDVTGVAYVGGLAGHLDLDRSDGGIRNCYSISAVTAESCAGGLVGDGPIEAVVSSFWCIERSAQTISGGGEGVSTAAMQDPNTFIAAGWDFFGPADGPSDIWTVDLDTGYPLLWWQVPEAELPELPRFSEGKGTLEAPYLISCTTQLNSIGHNPRLMEAHFRLTADIDLTNMEFYPIGNTVFPFAGVLDGNGRAVSRFIHVSENEDHVGLFGYVAGADARIVHLTLTDPNLHAVTGDYVGALVGYLGRGTVMGCRVAGGMVSGQDYVGGLVGYNDYGLIADCGTATTVIGRRRTGGLLGYNVHGTVATCRSAATVAGELHAGGLLGHSANGVITNCYSTGVIIGSQDTGGLLGYVSSGSVADCYAAGVVIGDNHGGGLVGDRSWSGRISASFWDVGTSGLTESDGGTGLTTAQMMSAETFLAAGWTLWERRRMGHRTSGGSTRGGIIRACGGNCRRSSERTMPMKTLRTSFRGGPVCGRSEPV